MILANLIWVAPDWVFFTCAGLGLLATVVLLAAYLKAASTTAVRFGAALLKTLAYVALLLCLLEPCWSGMRPQPGTNLFVLLADNSQSLQMHDRGSESNRGDRLQDLLTEESDWRTRLGQNFDVRQYQFDNRLQGVADFASLTFDGSGSALATALDTIAHRFRERPMVGRLALDRWQCNRHGRGRIRFQQSAAHLSRIDRRRYPRQGHQHQSHLRHANEFRNGSSHGDGRGRNSRI